MAQPPPPWTFSTYFSNHEDVTNFCMCMIKIFRGEGVVDGVGGNSERCLRWGVGVIKGSFQKYLKIGG